MDAPFENGEAPIEPDRPSRACAPSSAAPGARSVSIHAITWIGEKALDARRKKRFAASLRPRDVATPEHATEACKGVPPAMVPDPPGVEDDGERVAGDPDAAKAVIAARGLESNADFGVVAALMDRFGWPAVSIKDLADCFAPGEPSSPRAGAEAGAEAAEPECYGAWPGTAGPSRPSAAAPSASATTTAKFEEGVPLNFVRLSLAKFRAEQKAAQEAAESTCRRKIGKLAAPRRCRLLRLAFEIALEWDAQLKSRIDGAISRADRTAPRSLVDEHTVGVDAAGGPTVLEDGARLRRALPQIPPGPPGDGAGARRPADPRKQPDKRKRPRAPPPPAVPPRKRKRAPLLEATHGDELWLSKVLRDELAPHILRTRRAAVNAVKKEERAARRQRAIMRDLGTVRDVGTRRAAARPVDYTGAAYDAQIKAAERAHGRYI
ncbi:hypothetical protein JL720_149 [Aureococcus anophagefferens]|nr:hypothetical protein JL720_149 [Aureococcus anophagefferens]